MLTAEQLRAARAMLRWDQARLAGLSGLSIETVKRLERLSGELATTRAGTLDVLQRALERGGVEFISRGVRLRDGMIPDAADVSIPVEQLNSSNDE